MPNQHTVVVATITILVAFASGAVAAHKFEQVKPVRAWLIRHGMIEPRVGSRDDLQIDPQIVACPEQAMVVLIAGQSNAANQGQTTKELPNNVVNFHDGNCYRARDPLLGASGNGGSIWSRVKWQGPIVLASVAVGQSRVDEWEPGGRLWPRLTGPLMMLADRGIPVTHILWHQGETDATDATHPDAYRTSLKHLVIGLRERTQAKIFLAVGTHCHGVTNAVLPRQRDMVIAATGVQKGPDTDHLGDSFRIDGCHLNDRGQTEAAKLWQEVLVPDFEANAKLANN